MYPTLKRNFVWLLRKVGLALPRRFASRTAQYLLSGCGVGVFQCPEALAGLYGDLERILEQRGSGIQPHEALQLYLAVRASGKVEGELAEVGVFRGGSARIICAAKGARPLHLFDTFKGIPRVGEVDRPFFYEGQYAAPLKDVEQYLAEFPAVFYYEGVFPEAAASVAAKKFALVHLDVDTYESTLACLKFFFPRMHPGGILISHDYSQVPGVQRAFEEFLAAKSEPLIELLGSQCLLFKL